MEGTHVSNHRRMALMMIPDGEEGLVGIHDGVRPFVSISTIARCYDTAGDTYAAIPVMPATDTLRYIDKQGGGKTYCEATIEWYKRHRFSTLRWHVRLSR